jgi:hypothetical protein
MDPQIMEAIQDAGIAVAAVGLAVILVKIMQKSMRWLAEHFSPRDNFDNWY